MIRMVPPSLSVQYADDHDCAVWTSFCDIMGARPHTDDELAKNIATLPARHGGLGLRSARRMAPGAFWASWATSLPVIGDKMSEVAGEIVASLEGEQPVGALAEAAAARCSAMGQGGALPTWTEIAGGAQPPQLPSEDEHESDFDRGWQYHICSLAENFFREQVVLPSCDDSRRALLLSQSGGAAGAWLRAIPSEPDCSSRHFASKWPCDADCGGRCHSQEDNAAEVAGSRSMLAGTGRRHAAHRGG